MFKYIINPLKSNPNLFILLFSISALFGFSAMIMGEHDNPERYMLLFFECFSGMAIVYLWESIIKERPKGQEEDLGLFYLAWALLTWSIGDNLKIYGCKDTWGWDCVHNCISTINSIFFLFSIKFLELKNKSSIIFFRILKPIQLLKNNTLLFVGFFIITMNVIFAWCFKQPTKIVIKAKTVDLNLTVIPDALLSFIIISLLLLFFYEVFKERKLERFNYLIFFTGFTIVLAQVSGFYSDTNLNDEHIDFFISVIGRIYRPLLIVLFFVLSLSWLWYEKEKMAENRKRDMNHAIRGTLLLLNKDISRKVEKYSDNFKVYLALSEFKVRVKAMSDLHNQIHNVESKNVAIKPLIKKCLREIKKALGYENMPLNGADTLEDFKCNRANAQKILAILLELSINANKVAHEEGILPSEKHLEIFVVEYLENLVITVADNGRPYNEAKIEKGYGSRQLDAIMDDLDGYIEFSENNVNGRKGTAFKVVIPLNNIKN